MTDKPSRKNQDPASCEPAELFSQLGPAVYAYALHMLAEHSQAEEVLSETFLRICSRRSQYRSQGNISSWVLGITHRLCIDVLRLRARRGNPAGLPQTLVSSEPSPAALSQWSECKRFLIAAIEKLPAEQKEVVMLKIYGQLTFREISELLEIPLNTALGRMHLAIKRLAQNPNLAKMGIKENEM